MIEIVECNKRESIISASSYLSGDFMTKLEKCMSEENYCSNIMYLYIRIETGKTNILK